MGSWSKLGRGCNSRLQKQQQPRLKECRGCGSVGWAIVLTPELCGSNPVIGKFNQQYLKDKNEEKEARNGVI